MLTHLLYVWFSIKDLYVYVLTGDSQSQKPLHSNEIVTNTVICSTRLFSRLVIIWFLLTIFQAPEGCHPAHSHSASAQHHHLLFLVSLVAGKSFQLYRDIKKHYSVFLFVSFYSKIWCLFEFQSNSQLDYIALCTHGAFLMVRVFALKFVLM